MGKQFPDVSNRYGAPMGRKEDTNLDDSPKSVRLFKVRINGGGYDDGGAYWGVGAPIYCAIDQDGAQQFVRAMNREQAAFKLRISSAALKNPLPEHGIRYGLALLEGRAPMPEIRLGAWGWTPATSKDVLDWMASSGKAKFGRE